MSFLSLFLSLSLCLSLSLSPPRLLRNSVEGRYETLGFEKRDRSHLFQTELEDFLVTDTGRYYRWVLCSLLFGINAFALSCFAFRDHLC